MTIKNNETFTLSLTFSLLVVAIIHLSFWTVEASALCIKAPRANLRQGPGTNYEKLWEVFQYMPFQKLKKKGNWYRVKDVDGDIYWVHKKLITNSYKCAVVKNDTANFRTGPGTQHSQVSWSPLEKYFAMKILKIKGNWAKIKDGAGDVAWVHRSLIWVQ